MQESKNTSRSLRRIAEAVLSAFHWDGPYQKQSPEILRQISVISRAHLAY